MHRHFARVLLCVFVSLVCLTGFAQNPPSGDTYAASSTPTTNFGASTILPVMNGVNSYISFDLSSLPSGVTVNKATLRVFLNGSGASFIPGTFDVYRLNSAWNELTLTYNNAPALGTSATGGHPITVTTGMKNDFVLIDITSLVQGW